MLRPAACEFFHPWPGKLAFKLEGRAFRGVLKCYLKHPSPSYDKLNEFDWSYGFWHPRQGWICRLASRAGLAWRHRRFLASCHAAFRLLQRPAAFSTYSPNFIL